MGIKKWVIIKWKVSYFDFVKYFKISFILDWNKSKGNQFQFIYFVRRVIPAERPGLSRDQQKKSTWSFCLFVCLSTKKYTPVWFEKTLNIVSKYHKFCNILNVFFWNSLTFILTSSNFGAYTNNAKCAFWVIFGHKELGSFRRHQKSTPV